MEEFQKESSPKSDYIKNIKKDFPYWENEIKRINEKKEKLYSDKKRVENNYDKIVKFCKNLEKKYGKLECLKYLTYHLVIGSTPKKEQTQFFDFEGEDSIEKFLDKLLEEQNLDIKNKNSN